MTQNAAMLLATRFFVAVWLFYTLSQVALAKPTCPCLCCCSKKVKVIIPHCTNVCKDPCPKKECKEPCHKKECKEPCPRDECRDPCPRDECRHPCPRDECRDPCPKKECKEPCHKKECKEPCHKKECKEPCPRDECRHPCPRDECKEPCPKKECKEKGNCDCGQECEHHSFEEDCRDTCPKNEINVRLTYHNVVQPTPHCRDQDYNRKEYQPPCLDVYRGHTPEKQYYALYPDRNYPVENKDTYSDEKYLMVYRDPVKHCPENEYYEKRYGGDYSGVYVKSEDMNSRYGDESCSKPTYHRRYNGDRKCISQNYPNHDSHQEEDYYKPGEKQYASYNGYDNRDGDDYINYGSNVIPILIPREDNM